MLTQINIEYDGYKTNEKEWIMKLVLRPSNLFALIICSKSLNYYVFYHSWITHSLLTQIKLDYDEYKTSEKAIDNEVSSLTF